MTPSFDAYQHAAQAFGFRPMDLPQEPEQPREALHAPHLIPHFAFRNRLVGTDACLEWTPRDYAIAAAAVGGCVAMQLRGGIGDEGALILQAREAWHYAQRAMELEELELHTVGQVIR